MKAPLGLDTNKPARGIVMGKASPMGATFAVLAPLLYKQLVWICDLQYK